MLFQSPASLSSGKQKLMYKEKEDTGPGSILRTSQYLPGKKLLELGTAEMPSKTNDRWKHCADKDGEASTVVKLQVGLNVCGIFSKQP